MNTLPETLLNILKITDKKTQFLSIHIRSIHINKFQLYD